MLFYILLPLISWATVHIPVVSSSQEPFWQNNTKAQERLSQRRDILVLVKSSKNGDGSQLNMNMQGVGQIKSSASKAFLIAKNFSDLTKVSSHIKEVKVNPMKQSLYLRTKAYGYQAVMFMNYQFEEKEKVKEIRFRIFRGTFAGMMGLFRFKDIGRRKSQIEFLAEFKGQSFSIPKLFLEFGLEVVLQKVAGRMRSFIESQP